MSVSTAWPDRLPLPTFQDYAVEPLDAVLRTEMEAGPARQRRRYTQTPLRMSVRWHFTAWQYALFVSWFEYRAKAGGEWFSITLLDGLGMTPHEVRFAGCGQAPYRAQPSQGGPGGGARWVVVSALEVREKPVLSPGALALALTENMTGLQNAFKRLHTVVHTTLPNL